MATAVVLRNLHLIDIDGRITQAGAWLLARDIRKFRVSGDVACALFMGTDKVRILDRRDFHSDVYSMIDEVVAWILSKINVEYIIKHVKREERPELPEEAIREAVVNALAHRDYRSSANVQVYIFKDRLEIVSPGGLPVGMTEADLGIKSVPRNPLLFGILHRIEAMEKIGSGIRRIRDLCQEHGVAEPLIEVSDSWVTTVFRRSVDQVGTKLPTGPLQVTLQVTLQVRSLLQSLEGEQSRSEILDRLGLKDRVNLTTEYLRPALVAGLIEMTIPDKPTSSKQKYRLTARGRNLLAQLEEEERRHLAELGGSEPQLEPIPRRRPT